MKRLAVLTSGGDAPGMNAALRAVVRTALDLGAEVFAIYEGYQGMIEGGNRIRALNWDTVGGILHKGGTIIGTARSLEFRTRQSRLKAVHNLVQHGINALVVIGGDGSLTGANILHKEWPALLAELVNQGTISAEQAAQVPFLTIAGIVGSIDNDMYGTDMTIGADTALHRIVDAVDAISSTAASHQRAFVVEVMGRHCGYLALMGALASGADFAIIPENPPDGDNWEEKMCEILRDGRRIGRRDSIVIIAEGAQDRKGNPITSDHVKQVLEEKLGEDVRITVLGHVQRGGSPSAHDRILSTLMGAAAAKAALEATDASEPLLIGNRNNKIVELPLIACVETNHTINEAVRTHNYKKAMQLRGPGFQGSFDILRTLVRALPHPPKPGQKQIRFAIINAGGAAPGMNAAVRAAVRLGVDRGHIPIGVKRGFRGLINEDLVELDWMAVNGWTPVGGSELGTSRKVPEDRELYSIARTLEKHKIDAILMIGGWAGYKAVLKLYQERQHYPAFNIPILCLPASIDNNLPFSDFSIGADTALNSITEAVDKIKQSAVASNRCFVIEVMGHYCGYLALMTALATGAERAYIHEEGVALAALKEDIDMLSAGFEHGKRLALMIRNEHANPLYTTPFLAALFEQEGGDLYDVRIAVLGHLQQGGNPSPFDRVNAVRMANAAVHFLEEEFLNNPKTKNSEAAVVCVGMGNDHIQWTPMYEIARAYDEEFQRPKQQWWMNLRALVHMLAQPDPYFAKRNRQSA
ncbi:MAG: 6-phosphofructokinase [Chloroflexi bacterium]|nr:6-phosphofructokinase [Chloroflexota bacterium]